MEYELLLMNLMRGVTEKMPHVEECLASTSSRPIYSSITFGPGCIPGIVPPQSR